MKEHWSGHHCFLANAVGDPLVLQIMYLFHLHSDSVMIKNVFNGRYVYKNILLFANETFFVFERYVRFW